MRGASFRRADAVVAKGEEITQKRQVLIADLECLGDMDAQPCHFDVRGTAAIDMRMHIGFIAPASLGITGDLSIVCCTSYRDFYVYGDDALSRG
ncbi:hypothetical protein AXE86_03460 [Selenomonas sp. oral taxon 136]|nr:hypothetical protein AXE86_03460 [Selenomonas sp. oral taxon 136]